MCLTCPRPTAQPSHSFLEWWPMNHGLKLRTPPPPNVQQRSEFSYFPLSPCQQPSPRHRALTFGFTHRIPPLSPSQPCFLHLQHSPERTTGPASSSLRWFPRLLLCHCFSHKLFWIFSSDHTSPLSPLWVGVELAQIQAVPSPDLLSNQVFVVLSFTLPICQLCWNPIRIQPRYKHSICEFAKEKVTNPFGFRMD